jgi:hypothetical protein
LGNELLGFSNSSAITKFEFEGGEDNLRKIVPP